MKTSKLLLLGGMLAILIAGNALAQEVGQASSDLRQPASVRHVAYDYMNYYQDDASKSPSDAPPPAVPEETAPVADIAADCGTGCEPVGCGGRGCRGVRRRCCGSNLDIGGWLSSGYFTNAWGAGGNGPLGFNNIGDEMTMNQLWVYAGREANTGGYGIDWGFRVDYLFGVDGPDTQAFGDTGWDTTWNSTTEYGSAMPQLYGEIAINDLTVKFGRFYTNIGWEVVQAPDNFFYTHSYTMYYGEPFTHTGFLASYNLTDRITVSGGWTNGWDAAFDNTNEGSTFLGGIGLTLTDNASLTWATTFGDFGLGAGDIYMNSIVFELAVTDRFTYILQHDLGNNTGLGAGDNEWYGINQYLQYEINDCLAAGMRIEWFRDDDGARVITGPPGNAGNYYEVTGGLNWKPLDNLIVRPELRYDWYEGTIGADGAPFGNGQHTTQFSGGLDFIVTF